MHAILFMNLENKLTNVSHPHPWMAPRFIHEFGKQKNSYIFSPLAPHFIQSLENKRNNLFLRVTSFQDNFARSPQTGVIRPLLS